MDRAIREWLHKHYTAWASATPRRLRPPRRGPVLQLQDIRLWTLDFRLSPAPTTISEHYSPPGRIIARLFVMGGTIAQSSVGCRVSLSGHHSPPSHGPTNPTPLPGHRRHA